MRLIQLLDDSGIPSVGAVDVAGIQVRLLREVGSTYALANDTEFGLCAVIATHSLKHATHFKQHEQAGMAIKTAYTFAG